MKYIADDKKILKFIVDEKKNITGFARENHITPTTLNKALYGEPIMLDTIRRIAKVMGLHPHAIILASIAPKEKKAPPEEEYYPSRDPKCIEQWLAEK